MRTAAINELKAKLSDFLTFVKAGNEVLVTDRGIPVACIVPLSKSKSKRGALIKMEKQGLVKLGSGKLPKNFWKIPRPVDPKGMVLKALLDEREED